MFRKDDIKRLSGMLKCLDTSEADFQERVGNRVKGSVRSRDYRNAASIRRILEEIKVHHERRH